MQTRTDKPLAAQARPARQQPTEAESQFTDHRSETRAQEQLQAQALGSPQVSGLQALQAKADASGSVAKAEQLSTLQRQAEDEEDILQGKFQPIQRLGEEDEVVQGKFAPVQRASEEEEPLQGRFALIQRQEDDEEDVQLKAAGPVGESSQLQAEAPPTKNETGLPDNLKAGIESLSGLSMDSVRVHYNSSQPAQLNALAYAQGTDIHVAPGQEQHLPHEAWHVVQQAQGRVQPTRQMKAGVPINGDQGLEREADVMGEKATQINEGRGQTRETASIHSPKTVQRKILVNGQWYSFQSVYNSHGNPFLMGLKNNKIMELNMKQPNIDITEVDDFYEKIDESLESRKNIYNNFSVGRAMHLETPTGAQAQFLPFKSYQFNANTPFEISVFDGKDKGKLYPAFEKKMHNAISKKIGENEDIEEDLEEAKTEMEPLIFSEDYRTPGAYETWAKINKRKRDEINTLLQNFEDDTITEDTAQEKIKQSITEMTSKLPWAGEGGKKKFKKEVAEGKHTTVDLWDEDEDEDKGGPYWYGFGSPLREDEIETEKEEEEEEEEKKKKKKK